MSKRKFEKIERGSRATIRVTLPPEISQVLVAAGVEYVDVSWSIDGILITPWKDPELPVWAKAGQ